MAGDRTHQDPRTWVLLNDGKPLMKAIPKENLAGQIKAWGWDQAEFARRMSVSRTSVNQWLAGKMSMSDDNVIKAGLVLRVSPLYILDLTDSEWPSEFDYSEIMRTVEREELIRRLEGLRGLSGREAEQERMNLENDIFGDQRDLKRLTEIATKTYLGILEDSPWECGYAPVVDRLARAYVVDAANVFNKRNQDTQQNLYSL